MSTYVLQHLPIMESLESYGERLIKHLHITY